MKIWFTRPSTWDLLVRGIDRCEMWLQKPFYDTGPRGPERERCALFQSFPIGWRVVAPEVGDISSQVRVTVGEAMLADHYEDVANALWVALCHSVDGRGPTEGGLAPQRWMNRELSDLDQQVEEESLATFLFEFDAPPELWFAVAVLNGLEYQTSQAQWAQKYFPLDSELGIEPEEPPLVSSPAIVYRQRMVQVK